MSEIQTGHNSQAQLKSLVERIENIETQIKEFSSDRSDIYAEAKGAGFDVPALKAIVRARREDGEKRRNREAVIDTYRVALGIE